MRTANTVIKAPEFRVYVVSCRAERHIAWSEPEHAVSPGIVLAHRGMFRMRADGHRQTVDPTLGYVQAPGSEQRFAHPAGGDVCTFIEVGEPFWGSVLGAEAAVSAVPVDGRVELAHRLLLRSAADAADPVERLVHALTAVVSRRRTPGPPGRAALADRAREAIVAGHPESADLVRLARLLQVSPSHLSRTFAAHAGMTVSRYRNRVRVSRVLASIEEGETDLAALATAAGFADQAHLSRAVRAESGESPGCLRRLFATPPEPDA